MESDVVSGQQSAWVLLKKLGEGDAGEVFLVESLLEKRPAILKRPTRSAFASDVIRQSSQITTEGKILKALSTAMTIDGDFPASVPELLDQSRPGTAFSERMFIVIEKAPGFDLAQLARTAHLGALSGFENLAETPEEKRFLQLLAEGGQAPERVFLHVFNALLGLFDKIHQRHFDIEGIDYGGILWNDVKAEHLYWDPWRARLTVIDWGNGQLLEQDGATRDRRFSSADDYRQWLDEMGRFLEASAPALYERLEWPRKGNPGETDPQAITRLQERIGDALQDQLFALAEVRDREAALLNRGTVEPVHRRRGAKKAADTPAETPRTALETLHREIISFGEMPNYAKALSMALSWAGQFATSGQISEIEDTCAWAEGLPGSDSEHLRLVARLARITRLADTQGATRAQHDCLRGTVLSALHRDWPGVLWGLLAALRDAPEPDWWYDLISEVRRQELGPEDGDRQPFLVARRGLLTLQAMAERMERPEIGVNPASLDRLHDLIHHLREEILPNWAHIDPGPPHANLTYMEIDEMLEEIQAFSPEIRQALDRALAPARAQVRTVLEHWENGEFDQAVEGLRQVLLWDPDRRRVLRAEQALLQTPLWLEKVQRGPAAGEHYIAFISEIEFEGRELRGQVGPAGWIDLILEGCRQLRHGAWPPDLFSSLPLLVKEMPWLRSFERVERLPASAIGEEDEAPNPFTFIPLNGTARGKLGREGDLIVGPPLDGWIGEARGSSARVFSGQLRDGSGKHIPAAIKLMRMDKVDYSLPLFSEEVIVLNAMRAVPGITPLLECGFLNPDDGMVFPTGREASADQSMEGSLIRIGPMLGQEFVQQIEQRAGDGWIPYLAIQPRDSRDNLLFLCDAGQTGGRYQSAADLLLMSIQICEILHEAHLRNIVYRDHKILHYYWIEAARGIYMIDWNVAKLHPEGLSDYEKQMDLVQFGARALHHILTGRTAPGALPLGPTRPDEIEQAAKSYQAQWTYDDQRLPEDVRGILERVLAGDYNNAVQLRDDLKQSFLNLPEM